MKDWIGNSKSVYSTLSASSHAKDSRQEDDYYATDPKVVEQLLKVESFSKDILENSVGAGHIANVLVKHGYNVTGMDKIDRGYPNTIVQDFLYYTNKWNGDIICNPPYSLALDFAKHSLEILDNGRKLAMFLKIQFLETQKRKEFFIKNPPKYVYVFSSRVLCGKNGVFTSKNSSAVCYCWFICEKGFTGEPKIRWI